MDYFEKILKKVFEEQMKLINSIADLNASEPIDPPHLAEALQYRPKLSLM